MKKFLITALLLTSMLAHAEVDAQAMKVINDIQVGRDNNNQIKELRVAGDATIGGTLVLSTTTLTAAGTNTLAAATNAPALVSGAAPKWVTITIGGTDYLVQAYEKKP